MYETIERRQTAKSQKPLSIRLREFAPDKRVAFIDSVCAALNESRFGPGRSKPIAIRLTDWPDLEPAVFYELSPVIGPTPAYTVHSDSEMARRYSEDIICQALTPPNPFTTTIHIHPDHTSNQGRGSP